MKLWEEWLAKLSDNDWVEFTSPVQSDFTTLCKESSLLEERLEKHLIHIQYENLKLEDEEITMKDNNVKEVAR